MEFQLKMLDFYTEADREHFFGRKEEIATLCSLIQRFPVVVLTGESGAGKTSLLRAGIIPHLPEMDSFYFRINSDNREELLKKLAPLTGEKYPPEDFASLIAALPEVGKKKVILFDQFEEHLVGGESRWLDAEILSAIWDRKGITLLFSMRSDYLPLFMTWLKEVRIRFFAEQFFYLERLSMPRAVEIFRDIFRLHGIHEEYSGVNRLAELLSRLDADETVYPPHIQIVAAHILSLEKSAKPSVKIGEYTAVDIEKILSGYFDKELFKGIKSDKLDLVRDILDILVGREGLRRKLSLPELTAKLGESSDVLFEILDILIERRVIRRTNDDRYELIHDFLSRHFFESFSLQKRKSRRLQDMFHQALMDYRDSSIFLDERRLRIFLHNREVLELSEEGRELIVKSIVPISTFGRNPYIDLSMFDDLVKIYREERDPYQRQDVINRLKCITGYSVLPEIHELFETEEDPACKWELLGLLVEFQPQRYGVLIAESLSRWQSLDERYLEGMLIAARLIPEISLQEKVLPVLRSSSNDNVLLAASDTVFYMKNRTLVLRILEILEEGAIKSSRSIEDCIMKIDSWLIDYPEPEISGRLAAVVERIMKNPGAGYYVSLYGVYIRRSKLSASRCMELIESIQDIAAVESILSVMCETGEEEYIPVVQKYIENSKDLTSTGNVIRSLSFMKSPEVSAYLLKLFDQLDSGYVKADILYNEEILKRSETKKLLWELIDDYPRGSLDPVKAALNGIPRKGDNEDLIRLEAFLRKVKDTELLPIGLQAINSFYESYSDTVKQVFSRFWEMDVSDECRVDLASYLFARGSDEPLNFILDKLSENDEKFTGRMERLLFISPREPISSLLQAMMKRSGELPEGEAVAGILMNLIYNAANRNTGLMALIVYISKFSSSKNFFTELMKIHHKAMTPELRGLALIGLVEFPAREVFELISHIIYNGDWLNQRKLALYALGNLPPGDYGNSTDVFLDFIRSTDHYELCRTAINVLSFCTSKSELPRLNSFLEEFNSDGNFPFRKNEYIRDLFKNAVKSISDRDEPGWSPAGLKDLMDIKNYSFHQALGMEMFFGLF